VHRLPRGAPRLAGVLVLQRPPILTPAADCPQIGFTLDFAARCVEACPFEL
jgi:hypothetical protein